MPAPAIWAQDASGASQALINWLVLLGDPQYTTTGPVGGLLTWAKFLGLICLLSWVLVQFIQALRGGDRPDPRAVGRPGALLITFLVLLALGVLTALASVLEQNRILALPPFGPVNLGGRPFGPFTVTDVLLLAVGLLAFILLELGLWSSLSRGSRALRALLVLLLHGAVLGGVGVVYKVLTDARAARGITGPLDAPDVLTVLFNGARYGATYAGLIVLGYLAFAFLGEARHVRWRRLSAIAWHTIVESFRRTRAPWAVLAVFVIILAFTNWFLGRGRTAELARIFVSTLTVITTFLLMVMIVLMAPISIPNDIRQQTIYTVVSKPVRRLELIWGRLLGYMAVVTLLLAILGGVSIVYLNRVVGGRVTATRAAAEAALTAGRVEEALQLDAQATQLRNRLSARLPLHGSLIFFDSRDQQRVRGVDVGMEQGTRSHIEGATPARAIWRFDTVPDPLNPRLALDRRLPVEQLLRPGSLEALENRVVSLNLEAQSIAARLERPDTRPADARTLNERRRAIDVELRGLTDQFEELRRREQDLVSRARAAAAAGNRAEADRLRSQVAELHSPDIPIEMTFNVFRTTKGVLGEDVNASLVVRNVNRPNDPDAEVRRLFGVKEYYSRRETFPARVLVGSEGRVHITVQCQTPTQFLGMSEDDLYVLANQGPFETNYLRGLAGVWIQALVMTAVGLFAGTFLSWPVALLLTLATYLGGQIAFGFLEQFASNQIPGGGPFESLIRLLTHENLSTDLAPTAGVVAAQTLDRFFSPIMSSLIYVVPNLNAMDVSDTVASGFAVTGSALLDHVLLGLGYALPFTVAAYYILKHREVAA
jgi:ABC-type transport system involved in multi-copper enzyme maturation permease subunit